MALTNIDWAVACRPSRNTDWGVMLDCEPLSLKLIGAAKARKSRLV